MSFWFKWYIGVTNDAKFYVIAKQANTTLANVIAMWATILETAAVSDSGDIGSINGFRADFEGVKLGMSPEEGIRIVQEMRVLGLIDSDDRLTAWEKRQKTVVSKVTKQREGVRGRKSSRSRKGDTPMLEQGQLLQSDSDSDGECIVFPETAYPPMPDGISPDFLEIRKYYSENFRNEGERSGWTAYRQLLASKGADGKPLFPGVDVILSDLKEKKRTGFFDDGFAISLDRYLKEEYWKSSKPVEDECSCETGAVAQEEELEEVIDLLPPKEIKRFILYEGE